MNENDQSKQTESPGARQQRIMELLRRDGHIRVLDLSKSLSVSEITIRRDLSMMEELGLLKRTHGGAISVKRISREVNYNSRSDEELENKDAIGRYAAGLINDGDTVFINGGSTTFHIFRYINSKNVKIITNNAGCIGQIEDPDIELVLAGGHFKSQSNAFYGDFTNQLISQVNANKAILGVHGISCRAGLSTPIQHAAGTSRLMIERTRGEVIVVADHRKIGLISDYVTAPADSISTLVTDRLADATYIQEFRKLGIDVIQVGK